MEFYMAEFFMLMLKLFLSWMEGRSMISYTSWPKKEFLENVM